jgi:hypothetical protein
LQHASPPAKTQGESDTRIAKTQGESDTRIQLLVSYRVSSASLWKGVLAAAPSTTAYVSTAVKRPPDNALLD